MIVSNLPLPFFFLFFFFSFISRLSSPPPSCVLAGLDVWTVILVTIWLKFPEQRHKNSSELNKGKQDTICMTETTRTSHFVFLLFALYLLYKLFFFFFTRHQGFFFLLKILSNKNSISPPYFQCNYRAFKLEQEQNKLPKTDFQLLKLMVR